MTSFWRRQLTESAQVQMHPYLWRLHAVKNDEEDDDEEDDMVDTEAASGPGESTEPYEGSTTSYAAGLLRY